MPTPERSARGRASHRARTAALVTAVALALTACATGGAEPGVSVGGDGEPAPAAVVEGDDLALVDADGATIPVATVEDDELLTASVRPGGDDPATVLAVTRTTDAYELRYAYVEDGRTTDLYGFPYRLQVELVRDVADVPPTPVWSPDGSAIAWLEWDEDGTRLRTVGWLVHDAGSNPSDDQARYRLDGVPVGIQLEAWEVESDGSSTLTSTVVDGERWRIRLGTEGPIAESSTVT